MFLRDLTNREKILFWKLANAMVRSDGIVSREEIEMLEGYRSELEIDEQDLGNTENINEVLSNVSDIDGKIKKIVFFELLGLAYADNEYSKREKELIEIVKQSFSITDKDEFIMLKSIEAIMEAYRELREVFDV